METIKANFSDFTDFTEDRIFEEYRKQCVANQGDVLGVLYSGSKSPYNASVQQRVQREKIRVIINNTYPDFAKDPLFDLFTELLTISKNDNYNSVGIALRYIDKVNRNKRLSVQRKVGAAVLTSLKPVNFNGVVTIKRPEETIEEINKVQKEAVQKSKEQIQLANKVPYLTDLYLTKIAKDRHSGDVILSIIKEKAKFINRINEKIHAALFAGDFDTKDSYEKYKAKKIKEYDARIQKAAASENILTSFVRANKDVFVQYFRTHETLSEDPKWFVHEFITSKSTYEEVFRPQPNDNRSSFNYDFHFFCIQFSGIPVSDRQMNKITNEQIKTIRK